MIGITGAFASEAMDYKDAEFKDAVGIVFDRWGSLKASPDDKATQYELYRALRHANLLYKSILRQNGKTYIGVAKRLRVVVDEIGVLFLNSRNSSEVSLSIRRQLKEICEA